MFWMLRPYSGKDIRFCWVLYCIYLNEELRMKNEEFNRHERLWMNRKNSSPRARRDSSILLLNKFLGFSRHEFLQIEGFEIGHVFFY